MRRATNTINYGRDLPLAQGVDFSIAEAEFRPRGPKLRVLIVDR